MMFIYECNLTMGIILLIYCYLRVYCYLLWLLL